MVFADKEIGMLPRKKAYRFVLPALFVFVSAFLLGYSGLLQFLFRQIFLRLETIVNYNYWSFLIYPSARHCYILSKEGYRNLFFSGFSPGMLPEILCNAFVNGLFQPLFFCVLTPQVVMYYILFPFFAYGAIKYFKKVPLMIVFFIAAILYIGTKNSVIESIIRHRMPCDLIYLSISLAGLSDWITKRLS